MPIPQLTQFYRGVYARVRWNEDKTGIVKSEHHTEEHSWTALFIDLVYVAMFINVGHVLEACGSNSDSVSSAFTIFLIMFISRYSIDEYSNRFFSDDVFHRLVYFLYTFGVFIMTLNISSEDNASDGSGHRVLVESSSDLGNCNIHSDYSIGFFAGFIVTRISLVALYSMVCWVDGKASQQFWVNIFRHGASLIVMFILIFVHVSFSSALAIVCVIETLATAAAPALLRIPGVDKVLKYHYYYPLDIYEVQSRLGIFVMMVLGESMIQQLTASYNTHHTGNTYKFQGGAFLLIFCFGMQYFDAVHRKPGVPHALRTGLHHALFFIWFHPIVSFLILYATVTIRRFYDALQSGDHSVSDAIEWQLCVSCFFISISLTWMRMLHKGTLYHFMKASRLVHTVFRVAMASLHLVVHEVPRSGEFIVGRIWMHAVIALSLNMTDVLVSIKTTKKRLKALFVNESSTNLGTDLNSVQTPREVNVAIGGDEEDYYVDFNDRCSLVRLSLGQSDKSHEDSRQSDGDSSSRAAGYTERGSLSIKESKRKSGQSNKSSSLIEVLLDPVREESVCIDDV